MNKHNFKYSNKIYASLLKHYTGIAFSYGKKYILYIKYNYRELTKVFDNVAEQIHIDVIKLTLSNLERTSTIWSCSSVLGTISRTL